MKTVKLNNGVEMPQLGFGVYQVSPQDCQRVTEDAIRTGYRSIDTAAAYMNEEAVGRAVKKSGIPRDEFFVTTKLWVQDTGYDKTLKAFHRSLERLGLDYLDLYLIHQPFGDVHGSWRAMEQLYNQGLVRAIGVSNFQPDRIMDLILHNTVVPALNQIELHPLHQQEEAQKFLSVNGIRTESWGPFAEGREGLFTNETLKKIGKKHAKSVAQVVLRWLIQREIVAIPKTVSPDRMRENIDIFDFELTGDEMEDIRTLDRHESAFLDHRDPAMVKWLIESKFEI